jgi:hypothetical protein
MLCRTPRFDDELDVTVENTQQRDELADVLALVCWIEEPIELRHRSLQPPANSRRSVDALDGLHGELMALPDDVGLSSVKPDVTRRRTATLLGVPPAAAGRQPTVTWMLNLRRRSAPDPNCACSLLTKNRFAHVI